MKLSQFFPDSDIISDNEFDKLGYVDSATPNVLAYADSLKYFQTAVANPNVTCLITTPELSIYETHGVVVSSSPRETFYKIHLQFVNEFRYDLPFEPGIGLDCKIHSSSIISDECRIGDNVTIGEQVVIRSPVWIGSDVIIEPGVKLGVEGILYNKTSKGVTLIPHSGYVRIHDNVSLMTNSIVVRSIHDTDVTEIGTGTLIGLATIIGHEAKVGAQTVISNQCVLARRCVIDNGAFLGTNVMIKEHVHVGKNARIMAGSVVINDIAENSSVSGNFAIDHGCRMLNFVREKGK